MDNLFELERALYNINFSQGREQRVWDEIMARISDRPDELQLDELDNVAGGVGFADKKERDSEIDI